MKVYTLKVADIRVETQDTITLCFKQPALKKIKYEAGQYLTLIFRINGRRYLRPYSFSSAPLVDVTLNITIKRVNGGIVSNHIHDQVKVGDSVEVLEPMGEFTFKADPEIQSVFLWGVGSGITPLYSIAKYILKSFSTIDIHLIYGSKDQSSTIFYNSLEELIVESNGRLVMQNFQSKLSLSENYPFLRKGRIRKNQIENIISNVDLKKCLHYICGPFGLKESVKDVLKSRNVQASHIYSEDFELLKDPTEFTDIITRQVRIDFNGSEHMIEVIKGKSILECSLDAGLELPYSCQTGDCNTCKGILLAGGAKMIGISNTRDDLKINEYLLCCSYPTTDDLIIKI
jgi:ring-1,2-phenylacetyl-CoA epoxidase subunit PaaE